MLERKLKGHAYMQAHIESNEDGSCEVLVSYTTGVVYKYNDEALEEEYGCRPLNAKAAYWCRGLYSNTTIHHISLYCHENDIDYYVLRLIAGTSWLYLIVEDANPYKHYFYNFNTGEILEIIKSDLLHHYIKIKNYIHNND